MVLPSTWVRLLHNKTVQLSLGLGANIQSTRAFWSHSLAREHTQSMGGQALLFVAQNRGRSRPRCSADRIHRRRSFQFWKLCQAIWWTCRHWCLGSLDTDLLALAIGVVGGSRVVVSDDGELWRFLLLFTECDEFEMTHYNGADEVCSECLANRTNRPFTEMRADAAWRLTEEQPLLSSPFFNNNAFIVLDLMHVTDCKGVTALVLGSIVSLLLADDRLGTSKDVRSQLINTMLAERYDQHFGTHRLPPVRLANGPICMDLQLRLRTCVPKFPPSEVCAIVGLTEGR